MEAVYSWDFVTMDDPDAGDGDAPQVVSVSPYDGAVSIGTGSVIRAWFSEAMDADTIDTGTFLVYHGAVQISGSVTYNANSRTATFAPASPLETNAAYAVTVTTGAEDASGMGLESIYTWGFTTGDSSAGGDGEAPYVSIVNPADGATEVDPRSAIRVQFNEPMNEETINSDACIVMADDTQIRVDIVYSPGTSTATLYPRERVALDTVYTVTIMTGVQDISGLELENEYSWSFKTYSGDGMIMTGGGCGSEASASTFAGRSRPVSPGLMSLLITMLFPFTFVRLHRNMRRKRKEKR